MDDQTAIATAAGVTFASVAGSAVADGTVPSGRLIANTCLAFAGLGLLAMASPDIGKGLAIAVAGTAFATKGLPLLIRYFPGELTKAELRKLQVPLGIKNADIRPLSNPIANALTKTAQGD